MHNFKRVAGCGAVLSLITALFFTTDFATASSQTRRSTARSTKVAELYNQNCARCHGNDGTGNTPLGQTFNTPNLTDPEWWKKNSNITSTRSLRTIVAKGKAGMPGFAKKLKRSEINLLVDRMRRFRR
jgi:mono/diheme cytochrome c family protein